MNEYRVPIKDIKVPDGYEAVDFRELLAGEEYVMVGYGDIGLAVKSDEEGRGARLIVRKIKPKLKLKFDPRPFRVGSSNFNNAENLVPGSFISFTTEFRDKNGNNPQTMYAYATVVESDS